MPAVSVQLNDFIMPATPAARSSHPGLFARLAAILVATRQHQAEREIAKFIELQGGRMTDDLERQIERRFV